MSTTFRLTRKECMKRLLAQHELFWFWGFERLVAELTGDERRWEEATMRQAAIKLTAEPLRRWLKESEMEETR